jgi:RNA polymerase subunit RPABC4/transcription elongation factor Spt4
VIDVPGDVHLLDKLTETYSNIFVTISVKQSPISKRIAAEVTKKMAAFDG